MPVNMKSVHSHELKDLRSVYVVHVGVVLGGDTQNDNISSWLSFNNPSLVPVQKVTLDMRSISNSVMKNRKHKRPWFDVNWMNEPVTTAHVMHPKITATYEKHMQKTTCI